MTIEYKTGDVIEEILKKPMAQPQGTFVIHSCNALGEWGTGIAKEMKDSFPVAYENYRKVCIEKLKNKEPVIGNCILVDNRKEDPINWEDILIVCLINSFGTSSEPDSEYAILLATYQSLFMFAFEMRDRPVIYAHMPKINSGRFKVPWNKTLAIITAISEIFPNIEFTIWEKENVEG